MALFPFPASSPETAAVLAFRNPRTIADEACPRRPVAKTTFRYLKHALPEGYTVPDTRVGRRSRPNEVEFSATETLDTTQDYGLDDTIPTDDVTNAPPGLDPTIDASLMLAALIDLDREIRVANLLFDLNQYPVANRVTLAGTDQWSDYVSAASDPIADIAAGLDALVYRPNIMILGRATFTKLASHPKIVQAVFGTNATAGIVARDALARLFDFDKVLVGESWVNTAKKGQPMALARVWGKHAALLFIDQTGVRGMPGFCFTAQYGQKLAGSQDDGNIGMRGGKRVRVGESVKEVISAPDLGFFIQNAVA